MHIKDTLETIERLVRDISFAIYEDHNKICSEHIESYTDEGSYEVFGDDYAMAKKYSGREDDDDERVQPLSVFADVTRGILFGLPFPEYSIVFGEEEGLKISMALQHATCAIRELLKNDVNEWKGANNARKTWSKTELRCLVEAFLIDGRPISVIASKHRRSTQAIRKRLNLLGIRVTKTRY